MATVAERRYEGWRVAAWSVLVLALIGLAYGSRAGGEKPPEDALYRYETGIAGIVVYGLLFVVLLWLGRGVPRRELFALRRPRSWGSALWWSFLSYVLIFLGAGLILYLLDAGDEQGLTPDGWDSSRAGAYAVNFVAVALVGPVVEELLYRGAGIALFARWGLPLAVAVTSLAFGLAHGLVLALAALVLFGLVTALLRLKTDSIYPCMLVHCAFNATSLVVAVAA